MTYEELCEMVLEARKKFEDAHCIPRTIWLSPGALNMIIKNTPNKPTFMGMNIMVGDLPLGMDFAVTQEEDDQ